MSPLVRILLLLAAAFVATSSAVAQSALPEQYRRAGVLRWGADAEGGAPFVFLDPARPAEGEVGFEVDLARELGAVLGVRTERVQAPYENLVPALERGDFDFVLNGFEATPERRAKVRFSRPYYIFNQQLTVGPGTTGVRSLGDLVGKRVGVLGQSMSHQIVLAHPGVEPAIYESNVTAYQDLVNGRIAGSLADVPIARAQRPLFPTLVDVGEPFHDAFYAMAVRREDDGLQRAIDDAVGTLLADRLARPALAAPTGFGQALIWLLGAGPVEGHDQGHQLPLVERAAPGLVRDDGRVIGAGPRLVDADRHKRHCTDRAPTGHVLEHLRVLRHWADVGDRRQVLRLLRRHRQTGAQGQNGKPRRGPHVDSILTAHSVGFILGSGGVRCRSNSRIPTSDKDRHDRKDGRGRTGSR